ncbi:MAG TPA: hypothetical protein VLC52_15385, partial [Anaerolineae bacterium]|nr:hypothetical protein [Anaerolineae bacterium]
PERTSPHSLARAGTLSAAYAYWLASASVPQATWLAYEMGSRFRSRLAAVARAAVAEALSQAGGPALADTLAALDRRLAYLLDRQQAALAALQRLAAVECLVQELQTQAEQDARHELSWARDAAALHATTLGLAAIPEPASRPLEPGEEEAARLCPVRLVRGPLPFEQNRQRLAPEEQEAWRERIQASGDWRYHTLSGLALFWADGSRSLLDIADRVELEANVRDVDLLLHYFRLLHRLGLVELRAR